MLKWFEKLSVEIVGTNVIEILGIKDIVMLERACGSKASHQHFMNMITYSPSVILPLQNHSDIITLEWFAKRRCKLHSLTIFLPGNNAMFHVKNFSVDNIELRINSKMEMHDCQPLFESDLRYKVKFIDVTEDQNKEVMEQLSVFAENIEKMRMLTGRLNWLTVDILSRWKLKEIILVGSVVNKDLITLIVQTCTELTSVEFNLWSTLLDDSVMNIFSQHFPKLKRLLLSSTTYITYNSLISLSERGLPIKELNISNIPLIRTADIARRCSHALSCIRYLNTANLDCNGHDASILLPYMT